MASSFGMVCLHKIKVLCCIAPLKLEHVVLGQYTAGGHGLTIVI
jgi:hypothetical protein